MTVAALCILVLANLAPGPAFVKARTASVRSCPKDSCASAKELAGGTAVKVLEVTEGWAKVDGGWIASASLAPGVPAPRKAASDVKLLDCAKPDCKSIGTAAKGSSVGILDQAGDGALVVAGNVVGYVLSTKELAPGTAPAGAVAGYVPPAEPPKYVAPAEPPQYIPPSEPPRYIPADAPPIYIPPAQPAAVVMARAAELKKPNVFFVRRPLIEVLGDGKVGAKPNGSTLPGGAKVHVRKSVDAFAEVSTSETANVPALGWVKKDDLRDLPPMIFKSKNDDLAFFPCPEAKGPKCKEEKAKGLKIGDALVAIDESADKKMSLVLLPGQKAGSGWVRTAELDPGK